MKHFLVMGAFVLAYVGVIALFDFTLEKVILTQGFLTPLISVLSSVICKYMGWNK